MRAKLYVVCPIINGHELASKRFKSRELANDYAFKLIDRNDLQVEDVIKREKHVVEYICEDHYSRFIVSRK